jgi:4-aminobutyrate--pyruvate transaminase
MSLKNSAADLESADQKFHLHSQTDPIRHAEAGSLMIVQGDGASVTDVQGNRYLDAVASLWCASLGFSNRRLAAAGARALETLPVYHTFNHRSNPYAAELSARVAELAPFADARVFFTDGGSEAVESMIKMAWYYQVARGAPERRKIIARRGAFHGSTVLAARLSGLPAMHRSFNLPDCNVIHTSRPHFYRDGLPGESEADFSRRMAAELEALILAEGPETIAAFIAEPVMGAGGVIVHPEGYFREIGAVLKRHDILLLSDEVICGFGRTGNWFGCQTLGYTPDMMSVAKGLSAGYAPIGGVIVAPHVYAALAEESHRNGVFSHGFTYSGHPVSAAIALEALAIYREMDLPAVARHHGVRLRRHLESLAEIPIVGNVRSLGFLAGVELMADRERRLPFSSEMKVGAMVERRSRTRGLIVRNLEDTIAICPPYTVTDAELDQMMARLATTLKEVMVEIGDEIGAAALTPR